MERSEPVVLAINVDGVFLGFLGLCVEPDLEALGSSGRFNLNCCQLILPAGAR